MLRNDKTTVVLTLHMRSIHTLRVTNTFPGQGPTMWSGVTPRGQYARGGPGRLQERSPEGEVARMRRVLPGEAVNSYHITRKRQGGNALLEMDVCSVVTLMGASNIASTPPSLRRGLAAKMWYHILWY